MAGFPHRPVVGILLALAWVVVGCGGSEGLISERRGAELLASIDTVERAVNDEQCVAATAAAQEGRNKAGALPGSVDRELRRSVRDGFDHLLDELRDCGQEAEETPTPTPSPSPTPTETAEPSPTPTATPTPEATPTATVPPVEPPPDTGGVEPDPGNGVGDGG